MKVALGGIEKELGVFVCGGKGKTSRKTPEEIQNWGNVLGLTQIVIDRLTYASRASAKVDSALIQDGFTLYHHNLIFASSGEWAVIQQGMNTQLLKARRYHWLGKTAADDPECNFINEPHSGIASQLMLSKALDLTSRKSEKNRSVSIGLVHESKTLYRDLKIISLRGGQQQLKILDLPDYEFHSHPVEAITFTGPRLEKNIRAVLSAQPTTFEKMLMLPGIGGKTIRAVSLVAEVIYGAKPSYEDPARYTFAHGGKDGTPYPVDRTTYDKTLNVMESALRKSRLAYREKETALRQANKLFSPRYNPEIPVFSIKGKYSTVPPRGGSVLRV